GLSHQIKHVSRYSASFINIVETDKSPTAFGQFEHETNWRVLHVVRCFLERTVDLISLRRLFSRFHLCETLRSIGLAFKNFVIPAKEVFFILYGFYPIGHRHWELGHLHDRGFIACGHCRLKFLPERRELGFCKRAWKRQQNPNPG